MAAAPVYPYALDGRQRLYCSGYCGQRYRAEIALDEALRASLAPR